MTIIYGRVPHPPFLQRRITKAAGVGQDNLGKRSVKGVVLHRMIGTLWGTDTYFGFPSTKALTDYGIGVVGTDGASNDGKIIQWNDPLGYQSGWASGPVNDPYGDGLAFLKYYDWDLNVVNRDQVSIEISGRYYSDPISPASIESIAALIAYWADQRGISYIDFPKCPEGMSFVRLHQEYTIGTGKICPGDVVMQAINQIIQRAKDIMKQYQVVEVVQEPTTPEEKPVETDIYPVGMNEVRAKRAFGRFKASNGKTYGFDANGKVSKFWLAQGAKVKRYPRLIDIDILADNASEKNRMDFYFSDGSIYTTADGKAVSIRG